MIFSVDWYTELRLRLLFSVGKAGTVATGALEWGAEEDNVGTRGSNMRLQKIV